MKAFSAAAVFGLVAVAMCGCSTWRCRGFINVQEKPVARPSGNYSIESVKFVDLPTDPDQQKSYAQLVGLSRQDSSPYASYRDDLAKFIGFTNGVAGATALHVIIAPASQVSAGWSTVFWPLCGTLGVMPAHFSDQVPFEVSVDFGSSLSRPIQAMVCADRQLGLSRYDMDMPPLVRGASAEMRDDGTVGTGSELRDIRQREVFIRTVADAVLQVIAEREKAEFVKVDTPNTEFGPVMFPEPIKAKVKPVAPKVVSVKNGPTPEEIAKEKKRQAAAEAERRRVEAEQAAKRIADAKEDAFAYPRDAEEKKLKSLVLSGFLDKNAWWQKVSEHRQKADAAK